MQGDPLVARLPWLRRPSGGLTLVHHHELTYALALLLDLETLDHCVESADFHPWRQDLVEVGAAGDIRWAYAWGVSGPGSARASPGREPPRSFGCPKTANVAR